MKYYSENKEKVQNRTKEWYAKNKEQALANITKYTKANYELHRERCMDWRERNRQKIHEIEKRSRKINLGAHYARNAKRRAAKLKATVKWADNTKIKILYEESIQKFTETGLLHHVDHIIPLQGENVCGLHWEYNLRVIPAIENILKSNKLLEE